MSMFAVGIFCGLVVFAAIYSFKEWLGRRFGDRMIATRFVERAKRTGQTQMYRGRDRISCRVRGRTGLVWLFMNNKMLSLSIDHVSDTVADELGIRRYAGSPKDSFEPPNSRGR